MDLTEAEDIKQRWQEYTEESYEKDLHDPDKHDGVITHLEPDILECEVMGLRKHYYKDSGGDRIPAELFQILKDDVVKVPHSVCQQIWKTQQCPQDWKKSVFIPIPNKGNAKKVFKLLYNCTYFTLQQGNAQNSSSQSSTVHEPSTSRSISWISKRQRDQKSNC